MEKKERTKINRCYTKYLKIPYKKTKRKLPFFDFILFGGTLFVTFLGLYLFNFGKYGFSPEQGDWGAFGDFIGGTLNPIFAFLSLIAILMTIRIQSKELKTSTEELKLTRGEVKRSADAQKEQSESIKLQNFENTFFKMLDLHTSITRTLKIDIYGKDDQEEPLFTSEIKKTYSSIVKYKEKNNGYMWEKDVSIKTFVTITLEKNQYILGHYFRNIYQILKYIKRNDYIEDKKFYSNLLRAQFAEDELVFLFFNCLGKRGEEYFLPLLIKYEFLEHLPYSSNYFDQEIANNLKKKTEELNKEYPPYKVFGKNEKWEREIKKVLEEKKN